MKSAISMLARGAAWALTAALVAVLAVAVLVPRIAGATPYTILTGSMQPAMPPGTLVVVRPRDVEDISVGDVLTYQLESGKPDVVTHRVTAVGVGADGEVRLTTQGDANDSPDKKPVIAKQVRGVRWYYVPYLGYVNTVISAARRQDAVYVVAGLLLVYALVQGVGALRDRTRVAAKASQAHDSDTEESQEEMT